jgi:hypothetical protein
VAPALVEQVSSPLVSNRTLRGSYFSSPRLGPFEGLAHMVRSQVVSMPTVVAAVVRCRRTFSGGVATRVVGDVGGGRDGPPWPFGCRAIMIARARARFGSVGPARQWWMQLPAVNARGACAVRGARLPRTYKSGEREGGVPYLNT